MSIASKYVDDFLQGMETSGRALYNQTVGYVRRLDTNEEGALIRTTNNVNLIAKLSATYSEFLDSPTYEKRIAQLVDDMDSVLLEVTNKYVERYGFVPDPIYREAVELTNGFKYAMEGTLTDESVEYGIVTPAINRLYFDMGTGSRADDVIEDYRDVENTFVRYFQTEVVILMEQLERRLNQLYGSYNNVTKWRYVGPEDSKNREFCAHRVDGVYTEDEIRSWADEDWEGKIDGTNAVNIFANLGGYNCRHVLEPA